MIYLQIYKKKYIFLWLFFFISIKGNSQNFTKILTSTDSLILLAKTKKDFKSAAKIAHQYSIKQYKKKDYKKAIQYGFIEVFCLRKLKKKETNFIDALYNLGRFHIMNYEYENAITFFEEIITLNTDFKTKGQSYSEIGRIYYELGEFYKSINYYKKGILILEELKEYKILFIKYLNLSYVYDKLNTKISTQEKLTILNKAFQLKNKINLNNYNHYTLNLSLGDVYSGVFFYDFKKAKEFYKKNIKKALFNKDFYPLQATYINLGDLFLKKNIDSSFYYYDKSKDLTNDKEFLAIYYSSISFCYLKKKEFKKSLLNINRSLKVFVDQDSNSSIFEKNLTLLYFLKEKSKILLRIYKQTKDKDYLNKSINNVKLSEKLVNFIQKTNTENKTKLFWRKEVSEVYLLGVRTAYLLEDLSLMFYYLENNKAILLTQDIAINTKQTTLPKNVLDKKIALKNNELTIESNVLKEKKTAFKRVLQDSLFTAKQDYQKYIDSIQIVYPKSFNNQFTINQLSVVDVQKELDNQTVVVSYMWNKLDGENEAFFGLQISKNELHSFRVDSIQLLKERLRIYKKLISAPMNTKEVQEKFQIISFELYQQLFPKGSLKSKKLIIFPDGDLQNIPFESLITKEFSNEYLLKSNAISYAYSLSFLQYNSNLKRINSTDFIGYAPINFENTNLIPLKETEEEIVSIDKMFDGDVILKEQATSSHFLTKSNTSKIIHLATHADAGKSPWIAFSDKKLELYELYTYKNNADLVVLSGCSTSLGKMASGEGVLSLARGFFYAGANTVVSSLWNVNDKSTAKIMTSFYEQLKIGKPKADALRNAKLKYLENHSLSEASPYYWAPFIMIGNTDKLELSNSYLLVGFLAISVFILVVFYRMKRK